MEKTRVLFVCMGNICRSPAAEGVMRDRISRLKLHEKVECDSAGMIGYHEGELYDERMRKHAKMRGLSLDGLSRQFIAPEDFENFDYVIAMDDDNLLGLRGKSQGRYDDRIHMMTDFCIDRGDTFVPDPYYGGDQGFEEVLDIVEDGVDGLIEQLRQSGKV